MQKNGGHWVSYYQGWTGSATLKAMQREKEYIKWCKNIRKCSKRQLKSRFVRGKSYYQQKRDSLLKKKHLYKRGQLDPSLPREPATKSKGDHTYANSVLEREIYC